jgi:hypothetical protein
MVKKSEIGTEDFEGYANSKIATEEAYSPRTMGKGAVQYRIDHIEMALEAGDLSANRMMMLAGEWKALNEVLGNDEGPWAMLHRLTGI